MCLCYTEFVWSSNPSPTPASSNLALERSKALCEELKALNAPSLSTAHKYRDKLKTVATRAGKLGWTEGESNFADLCGGEGAAGVEEFWEVLRERLVDSVLTKHWSDWAVNSGENFSRQYYKEPEPGWAEGKAGLMIVEMLEGLKRVEILQEGYVKKEYNE